MLENSGNRRSYPTGSMFKQSFNLVMALFPIWWHIHKHDFIKPVVTPRNRCCHPHLKKKGSKALRVVVGASNPGQSYHRRIWVCLMSKSKDSSPAHSCWNRLELGWVYWLDHSVSNALPNMEHGSTMGWQARRHAFYWCSSPLFSFCRLYPNQTTQYPQKPAHPRAFTHSRGPSLHL